MKGLLLSDLYNVKTIYKNLMFAVICISFAFICGIGNGVYIIFTTIAFSMMSINLFAMDERSKWLKYVMILPTTRKQYVYEKYLMSAMFIAAGFVISSSIYGVGAILNIVKSVTKEELLICIGTSCSIGLFFLCLYIPILIKVGTEKARFVVLGFLMIPSIGGVLLANSNGEVPEWVMNTIKALGKYHTIVYCFIPVVVVLLIILSVSASVKIIEKKEF